MTASTIRSGQIEGHASNDWFTPAVFLSAFLLFQVQPIVSKALLPVFGGTPGVWTSCMLAFQLILFLGYAYADVLVRWLTVKQQVVVHGSLLLLACLFPVLPGSVALSDQADPAVVIVWALLQSVGLPFFVLSTSAPLLQAWYSRLTGGKSPYHLYALSNAGSLIGLVSYPFLFEPLLSLPQQANLWRVLFVIFGVVLWAISREVLKGHVTPVNSGINSGIKKSADKEVATVSADDTTLLFPGWTRIGCWFVLSLVPAVLLPAITNQVCLDVASVPFLWVLPLALYLLTFVICFAGASHGWPFAWGVFSLILAGGMLYVLNLAQGASIGVQVITFFAGLFAGCMVCHGYLAALKPHPRWLTLYYLIMSLAGLVGSAFVALAARQLFQSFLELELSLGALLLVVAAGAWCSKLPATLNRRRVVRVGFPVVVTIAVIVGQVLLVKAVTPNHADVLIAERSFFGVLRVAEPVVADEKESRMKQLRHGRIIHGVQFKSPDKKHIPTTYYTKLGGLGRVLMHHHSDRVRQVAVVGLGAGTIAAYGQTNDRYVFFEIDPTVIRFAREQFTYLSDSAAKCETVLADGRMGLANDKSFYDIIILDAFSGDAIPTHLLTKEAFQIYLDRLAPDGVIACHISNRHLDLNPVLAAAANRFALDAKSFVGEATSVEKLEIGAIPSEWVLLCRDKSVFQETAFAAFTPLATTKLVQWSDQNCSLFSVLKSGSRAASTQTAYESQVAKAADLSAVGKLAEAEGLLRPVVEAEPGNADAWMHLGIIYAKTNRPDDAILAYERALEARPDFSAVHNNLGLMLLGRNPARARSHILQAVQLDNKNARARVSLGNILFREGRAKEAVKYYEEALTLEPTLETATQNLAIAREAIGAASGGQGK
jgi:Flp pilus assembly protein TadD